MATTHRTVNAEELLYLPSDGQRHELVAGELRTMTPAGGDHGAIAMALGASLLVFVRSCRLGQVFAAETGFILARQPDTVRAADVAFVAAERIARVRRPTGYWVGAPDLVAEVLSPGDAPAEVSAKVADWLAHGTRLVLVVDPSRRGVAVHEGTVAPVWLGEADTLTAEPVVPGWSMPVRDLFALDAS